MSTVGQVVEEISSELNGTQREELNALSGSINASTTSLSLTYSAEGTQRGAYIAIDDEVMYVWSSSGTTATVRRAMLGTTAAAHDDGALITVNPAFPRGVIKHRAVEELRSWPSAIFRVATETLSASEAKKTSLLAMTATTDDVRRILDVRELPTEANRPNHQTWPRVRSWEMVADRASAGSVEIQITQRLRGASVWVAYAADFDLSSFADDVDLVTDVGIPDTCLDILRLGTIWRMVPMRELMRGRTDAQGQPRDAAEVQAGQNIQAASIYKTLRDQRLSEEAQRLREMWATVGG